VSRLWHSTPQQQAFRVKGSSTKTRFINHLAAGSRTSLQLIEFNSSRSSAEPYYGGGMCGVQID
jgi:hypothetical protein